MTSRLGYGAPINLYAGESLTTKKGADSKAYFLEVHGEDITFTAISQTDAANSSETDTGAADGGAVSGYNKDVFEDIYSEVTVVSGTGRIKAYTEYKNR